MSQEPLPRRVAFRQVARCVAATAVLLAGHRVHLPVENVGRELRFGDGSAGRVYRETVVDRRAPDQPCVLVVRFRLRRVHGRAHSLFRAESLLNTPLFVGFPGFVSKLWLAHDTNEVYRGLYEWDGAAAAEHYARCLWQVLALVSEPASISYRVLPGIRRDELLDRAPVTAEAAWWSLVAAG